MAYRIQQEADGHYSILVDDKLAYRLEHSAPNETQSWGMFIFQGNRPGCQSRGVRTTFAAPLKTKSEWQV